mgnify:CR=1 FL=1
MKSKCVNSLTFLFSACLLLGSSLLGSLSIFEIDTRPAFADDFECNDTSLGHDTNDAQKTRSQNNIDSRSSNGNQTTLVSTGTGDSAGRTDAGNQTTLIDKSTQETEKKAATRVVRGKNCDNANNNRQRLEEQKVRAEEDKKRQESMDNFFKGF